MLQLKQDEGWSDKFKESEITDVVVFDWLYVIHWPKGVFKKKFENFDV